ncbi:MAG: kynureninase [Rhodobacteraceae bacterium]|nr:MAG: kynureninase [Paracoccaceae bacterium]
MENDVFLKFNSLFEIPKDLIYLDGNSLGPLPKGAAKAISNVTHNEWGKLLIKGWNQSGWMDQPETLGNDIASLIGAKRDCVTVGDTLSFKVYQALASAIQIAPKDGVILSDKGNFPSDIYVANSILKQKNLPPVRLVNTDSLEHEIRKGDVSILMLTQVDYRTGYVHDIEKLTNLAKKEGIVTVWDLAHSVGALCLNVDQHDIDFAVGCTYKFLCGGPGAPAFLYVKPSHIPKIEPEISGWLGHEFPFKFDLSFVPASGIRKFRIGTPPVIQMAALKAALAIWKKVNMKVFRKKAQDITQLFIEEIESLGFDLELISPRNPSLRSSQVSFRTRYAYEKMQALIDHQVIGDYREPDIMRFGFNPLFNNESQAIIAAQKLNFIIKENMWKNKKYTKRKLVT